MQKFIIFTLDFCGNKAIDIGKAKPNEKVHASVFNGMFKRGKRRSIFLYITQRIQLNYIEILPSYFSNANIIIGGIESIGTGRKARVIAISVKA